MRAVVGADGRPHEKLTLSGELYLQTFGATDPDDVPEIVSQPRFARGEVWTTGLLYGAASAAVEVTPLVGLNGVLLANLTDPSALAMVSLSWSVSDEATVGAGVMAGLGAAIELLQMAMPLGRQGDWRDLAADALGVALSLLIWGVIRRFGRR